MKTDKWWTLDTIFVTCLGGLMTVILGASLFARLGSSTGSDLVPATVLQKVRAEQTRCQTVTDEDVENHAPRIRC